jgi:hypothetical protein
MWVVGDVVRDSQASLDGRAIQHLVSLISVEDDATGEELEVVWEIEPGTRVVERAELPVIAADRLDDPAELDAFLDAVRWGAVASADQRSLQAPFRSGIVIEDYQLEPLVVLTVGGGSGRTSRDGADSTPSSRLSSVTSLDGPDGPTRGLTFPDSNLLSKSCSTSIPSGRATATVTRIAAASVI